MHDDDFYNELQAQNDYLRNQLHALATLPAHRRKKYVTHEIYCKGCASLLCEVLRLNPYRVVRYRDVESTIDRLPTDMPPAERARAMAQRKPSIRVDKDWQFFPISDHEETKAKEARSLLMLACRCSGERALSMEFILGRPGKRTVSPPRQT
ncbi:hypothetical protein ACWDUN_03955 [Mycobacterium sp. NPDC003323]